MIFILEDNPARLVEMRHVLDRELPNHARRIEDDCAKAVAWLAGHQAEVDLISLDHDLDSVPRPGEDPPVDHGDGRGVVDHLEGQPPTCPVIVHTSNAVAGDGMYYTLLRAGWPVFRVYPFDHHRWIARGWADQIRELKAKGWLTA
ncbi:MAG TPA: cyclic-phosphate processing receiver domain-containing protein [Humisphaera sp.]